jgi:uncharacterized protein YeaC (DUF1315 family)
VFVLEKLLLLQMHSNENQEDRQAKINGKHFIKSKQKKTT